MFKICFQFIKKSVFLDHKNTFPQKPGTTVINSLEHQISMLEWYLRDHETLKPGVMAAEFLFYFFITILNK